MNKSFSRYIFTYFKINQDIYDNQYEKCISTVGQSEIQIKTGNNI